MTPTHQQPKKGITADGVYTITEKMLQKIEFRDGVLLDELRSRPAQPTEAQQRIDAAIKELERLVAFCDKRGFYHQRLKYEKVIALLQAGDQHD